ncbi:hypothetical protein [Chondromyces crocatus]|uniref:Uncharacterized protein n=1 Tax=Chondromyces crocatus TaxID=52 RepID=A0A0K1E615_CHOCO|nr:hypothetical protein [Chondromyces crocatus]AKT36013.1 uncharacterized protein CMC5_001250 [Chondromyces crocatus]
MTKTLSLPLDQAVTPVDVRPGETIVIKGALVSSHNGSVVDAATITWPAESPGGASVSPGGLIDIEGGGWHMSRRDHQNHEVELIATNEAASAPACAAVGVPGPCLPLRTLTLATSQLTTVKEWNQHHKGALTVTLPDPPPVAVAPSMVPYLQGSALLLGFGLLAALGWTVHRRRASSAAGQLLALADRVRRKLKRADPVLAATLTPVVDAASSAVRRRRVDPGSREAQRVADALRRIELRIEAASAAEEQQAADELVQEVESALEAADEVVPAQRRT